MSKYLIVILPALAGVGLALMLVPPSAWDFLFAMRGSREVILIGVVSLIFVMISVWIFWQKNRKQLKKFLETGDPAISTELTFGKRKLPPRKTTHPTDN